MEKRTGLLLALLAFSFAMAFGGAIEDRGYTVLRRYEERGVSYQVVRDPDRHVVTVGSDRELSAAQAGTLTVLVKAFSALKLAVLEDLKIVFEADRVKIIATPKSFVLEGVDLAAFMPSGMQLYYTDHLEYDFRLRVENLFLRVAGQYVDEQSFAARLVRIVRNPVEFIQSQDPEFMLHQIDLLRQRIDQAAGENEASRDRIRRLTDELAGLREQEQALEAGHAALKADYAEAVAALQARDTALGGEDERGRYSLLAVGNRGLSSRIKAPAREAVEQLIRLKKASPALTRDEATGQLAAAGFKLSKKEVGLVFGVYFGEFE